MSLWEKFRDAATGDWGNLAVTVGAGLLGRESSKSGTQTTQQQKMDPRMDAYVYGPDGQSGLLGSAFGLAQKQLETGGLNDMQRQGMDMQRQFLMSPQYQQGYGSMMGLGQNLMGAGIAGNPFTGGQRTTMGQANPFQYQNLSNAQLPDYSSAKPQMVQPATTQAQTGGVSLGGNGSGSGGGISGSGSSAGISEAGIDAALKAMALSENPAVRALFPTWAALLGLAGKAGADAGIGRISGDFASMNSIGTPTNPGEGGLLGMGTYADADGRISSISTPGMVDAADQATFGNYNPNSFRGGSGSGAGGFGGVNGMAGNASGMGFGGQGGWGGSGFA